MTQYTTLKGIFVHFHVIRVENEYIFSYYQFMKTLQKIWTPKCTLFCCLRGFRKCQSVQKRTKITRYNLDIMYASTLAQSITITYFDSIYYMGTFRKYEPRNILHCSLMCLGVSQRVEDDHIFGVICNFLAPKFSQYMMLLC